MMASQWVALVTVAVILTVGNCESHSDDFIDVEGCKDKILCEKRPPVYTKYQSKIDKHIQRINKTWKVENDLIWTTPCKSINNNCKTQSKSFTPFTYKGNTTKLVVQSKFYEQRFMTTTCKQRQPGPRYLNEKYVNGAQCFDSMGLENNKYTASCKPKQTTIKIFVYNINNDELERVAVDIDVCCICDITYLPENEN